MPAIVYDTGEAARLVRVTGTRLVPVKTNAALTSRPLDLVLALLKAYPRLGKPLFPPEHLAAAAGRRRIRRNRARAPHSHARPGIDAPFGGNDNAALIIAAIICDTQNSAQLFERAIPFRLLLASGAPGTPGTPEKSCQL